MRCSSLVVGLQHNERSLEAMKMRSVVPVRGPAAEATCETTASRMGYLDAEKPEPLALSPLAVEQEVLQLYRESSAGLLRYVTALCRRPEIAQEVVQEAFLRYYMFRLRTQIRQGGITWLYKTARNCAMDYFDEYFSKNAVGLEEALERPDVRQNHALDYERADLSRRALEVLTPRELECFRLRSEGLKYREIAEVLEIEAGTVGALLARGLQKIRKLFKYSSGDER